MLAAKGVLSCCDRVNYLSLFNVGLRHHASNIT